MDFNEVYKQVSKVLLDPAFLRRLLQILEKERRIKEAAKKRFHQSWNLNDLQSFGMLKLDAEIINQDRALYSTFNEFVVTKLPQPPVITADDLQEIAFSQLGGITEETKAVQLQRFVYHALLKIQQFQSGKCEIVLGKWTRAGLENDDDYSDGPLWEGITPGRQIPLCNGFVLDVEIINEPWSFEVNAYGFIEGTCTASAAQRLTQQIKPGIESLMRTLKLSATSQDMESARNSTLGMMKAFIDDPNSIDLI
jgi:hypothetical protein